MSLSPSSPLNLQGQIVGTAQSAPFEVDLNFVNSAVGSSAVFPSSLGNVDVKYEPPPPILFGVKKSPMGHITRKAYVQGIVYHPPGAIVEMPATGPDIAIAHVFPIPDPTNYVHPQDNLQYSLGGKHGLEEDVVCYLLHDKDTGAPVRCSKSRYTCCSVKKCSFNPSYAGRPFNSLTYDTWGEVFMKTLGFYCALEDHGCSFRTHGSGSVENETDADENGQSGSCAPDLIILKDSRSPRKRQACNGRVILCVDQFNHYFVRCERFSSGQRNHLCLRNLNEYNIDYLVALFNSDDEKIYHHESYAASQGYGPLVPCNIITISKAQRQLCVNWHRNKDGILQRGKMEIKDACPSRFIIFTPHNLSQCPYVIIVCENLHSHAPPPRNKTPESIRIIFRSLLVPLGWRLADATPRSIILDGTFMHGLRVVLGWKSDGDPGLYDLHPSLANLDHTARLINKLRFEHYPSGTGLQGAELLLEQQNKLSVDKRYLRCIKTVDHPKEGLFHIIVCMTPDMSMLLLQAKRPSIDTSFKRLHKWQEFEIEAWFNEYDRSVVLARAFTTSESSIAHHELFKAIFSIVEADTGQSVKFRHIHGEGIETVTADGHRGQALGLGLYCQEICQNIQGFCTVEQGRPLYALSPGEHLRQFYRYCFTHYTRNVSSLKSHVDASVFSAMMSLASADPLPNFDQTLALIRSGGKKAKDWLKDKQASDGFYTLGAIYWPESRMSYESWKAAPSTSNGNEQAHRNINRDGTHLTLLAGIMRGLHFDSRAIGNIKNFINEHIQSRDKTSNHFQRLLRGIRIKATSQQKNVRAKDEEISKLVDKTTKLRGSIVSNVNRMTLKREGEELPEHDKNAKRLKKNTDDLQEAISRLKQLVPQGSGSVAVSLANLEEPSTFLDNLSYDNGTFTSPIPVTPSTPCIYTPESNTINNSSYRDITTFNTNIYQHLPSPPPIFPFAYAPDTNTDYFSYNNSTIPLQFQDIDEYDPFLSFTSTFPPTSESLTYSYPYYPDN